jgi:hypothetical protein
MRNIKYIFSFVLLFIGYTTFAQTEDEIHVMRNEMNIPELERIANDSKMEYDIKYKKLKELATKNKWPLFKKLSDTKIEYLIGYDSNFQSIYSVALDEGCNITNNSNSIYQNGSLGLNIEGQGMIAGIWELTDGLGYTYPLTTHNAFQTNGSSRIGLGFDAPSEPLITSTNTTNSNAPATFVAGVLLGSDPLQPLKCGVAKKASCKALTFYSSRTELSTLAQGGLLAATHTHTGVDILDDILQSAPNLLNVISNGNEVEFLHH